MGVGRIGLYWSIESAYAYESSCSGQGNQEWRHCACEVGIYQLGGSEALIVCSLPLNVPEVPAFGREPFRHEIKVLTENIAYDDLYHLNTQSGTQWDGFRVSLLYRVQYCDLLNWSNHSISHMSQRKHFTTTPKALIS
jgi:hypothetical protein